MRDVPSVSGIRSRQTLGTSARRLHPRRGSGITRSAISGAFLEGVAGAAEGCVGPLVARQVVQVDACGIGAQIGWGKSGPVIQMTLRSLTGAISLDGLFVRLALEPLGLHPGALGVRLLLCRGSRRLLRAQLFVLSTTPQLCGLLLVPALASAG